jgi:signal transduction histidine kinase
VQTVVEAHGGAVTITNRPEGGAHATIQLPPRAAVEPRSTDKIEASISSSERT